MNNPLITIITVVYNGVETLDETIASIRAIRYKPLEYIIVDGESTDGTLNIIQRNEDMITRWVSERDQGIYDAMNKGWSAAANDSFILFLGAGDRILSLPDCMSCFRKNDVVYGTVRMGEQTVFKARADFHLKLYNSLHHQALLVNKALHPDPPFNCLYRVYADFDFNQRLLKSGANFVYSPELRGYARPGGVSDRHRFDETLRIVSKNFGFLWSALAFLGYYTMLVFPFLKRMRPIQDA